MALRFKFNARFQGIVLDSGKMYRFTYSAYQHDPAPLVLFLYWVEGTHPTTQRQWRFMQCINLNYIGRSYRKRFVEDWSNSLYTTRNVKLTWNLVKRKYPELVLATRRYFYSPAYYIKGLRLIPLENVESEVVGSLLADYSKKARIGFWTRIKKLQGSLSTMMRDRRRR
jgi:hypothetical protein